MNSPDPDEDNPYAIDGNDPYEEEFYLRQEGMLGKPPKNPYSDEYRDWVNRFDPYWR